MNILLIGECYSENLGDAVICQTVKKMIENEYSDADITLFDISGRINYQEYYNNKDYSILGKCFIKITEKLPIILKKSSFYNLYKNNERRYLRTILLLENILKEHQIDIAIFAGGAMFMDYFAGLIYYTVRKLSIKKIPVLFHSCGMGYLSEDGVKLLRKTFAHNYVKNVSIRDSMDRFLQLFGDITTPTETYDTAIWCNKFFNRNSEKVAEYGIGVISLPQHYKIQKDIITHFKKSNISFKVFTNGADENTAISLLKDVGYIDNDIHSMLMKRPITPEELVYNITGFEKIVSFRMHSLIVATSFGIEVRGFVWDDKVRTYLTKLGYPEWCCDTDGYNDFEYLQWNYNKTKCLQQKILELSKICEKDLSEEIKNVLTR